MKVEIDIPEPTRDELVEAMARNLLAEYVADPDDESGVGTYMPRTALCDQLRHAIKLQVNARAEQVVREFFDATIKERIVAAVDEVLAEGWQVTNQYGEARGPKVDLKGRITELLMTPSRDGYSGNSGTLVERTAKDAIDKALRESFGKEIAAAQAKLREQVDAVVAAKLQDTLKRALGLS